MQIHDNITSLNEEDTTPAPDYDPHHSWSDPLPQEDDPPVESSMISEDIVVPKTLRQHANDHYANIDHVQHAAEPVQGRKLKPNKKTKRRLSFESSASESDTMPSPKRLRRTRISTPGTKRELRSGVRKSTRTRHKSPS